MHNNKLPSGLNGYLLNNISINKINLEDNNLKIDFSKGFLNIKNKELVITGLVYSLTNLSNVDTIEIFVDNNYIENYNYKLDKNIGINKDYLLKDRKDIKKVTVFYYNKINNIDYLTPVTKYVNDSREKVEIIIDELSENVPDNLIGYLSDKVELLDYQEENDMMILNFSENFKTNSNLINQKTMNLISQSIFDNYDLEMVLFQENSQKIDFIKKKQ